ncbi:MAG: sulfotransferase family 2 domain-containing protein [Gloeomargaritaceae cyanobacterium C42_A2020_066]|nr:sulfotransferase family 2 domain-containing protein [Gloeomargaritaceae cyanobacterium C42_A2020_066]
MIICHDYKYIFIKTAKTAGSSIEIALSKFCGPRDIITPLAPEDEEVRKTLGFRGKQNVLIPFDRLSKRELFQNLFAKHRKGFFKHADASYIKRYTDPDVWDSYFKFCFERNPWDKAISYYYWKHKEEPRPTISEFVQVGGMNSVKGFELYTINSEIVVDRVFLYESLDEAMKEIAKIVGLPEVPSLPRVKGGFRRDKRHYRDVLSEKDREKISKVFAREIAHFGYTW